MKNKKKENKKMKGLIKILFKLLLVTMSILVLGAVNGITNLNILTSTLMCLTLPVSLINSTILHMYSNKKVFGKFFMNPSEFMEYNAKEDSDANFLVMFSTIALPFVAYLATDILTLMGFMNTEFLKFLGSTILYSAPVVSVASNIVANIHQGKRIFDNTKNSETELDNKKNIYINDLAKENKLVKNINLRTANITKTFKDYANNFDKEDKKFFKLLSLATVGTILMLPVGVMGMDSIKNGYDHSVKEIKELKDNERDLLFKSEFARLSEINEFMNDDYVEFEDYKDFIR